MEPLGDSLIAASGTPAVSLGEVSREFAEHIGDYPALTALVARRIAEATDSAATVWLLSDDGEWMVPLAAYHPDPATRETLWSWLARTRQRAESDPWRAIFDRLQRVSALPEAVDGLTLTDVPAPGFRARPIGPVTGAPLVSRDKVVGGVLALRFEGDARFTDSERVRLRELAGLAAPAMANARLLQDTERRLGHLEALRTIDMAIAASYDLRVSLEIYLDQVSRWLAVDAADVLIFDSTNYTLNFAAKRGFRTRALQFTRLSVGEGYAGQAAVQRRLVSVPDLANAPGSFARSKLFRDEGFVCYFAMPLIARSEVKGILEVYNRKPLTPDQGWLNFIEAAALEGGLAIESADIFTRLQQRNVELALAYDATLEGWSRALELRDMESEGHTRRVADMASKLALSVGVPEQDLGHIRRGALLHDIGKMGIPDNILLKPAPLTDGERTVMRQHPVHGFELLAPMGHLKQALDIPRFHHEHWDGSGYPQGLKGEDIPLAARVFAVVDVWDALRSDRPYRSAWSDDRALEYIRTQSGKLFDPRIVEVFLKLVES